MCFQMADTCNVQSHYNVRRQAKFNVGKYFCTSRENIAHCSLVGNVALFDSHLDANNAFLGISVYDWNVALNNWNKTREYEYTVSREDT